MKMLCPEALKSHNATLVLKRHGPGPLKRVSSVKRLEIAANLAMVTHKDLRSEVRSSVDHNGILPAIQVA